MKVLLTRILPDSSLSQFRVRDMRPDESIIVTAENAAEFEAAKRVARAGKESAVRIDGFDYRIESNSRENTVRISLFNPKEEI